MLIYNFATGKKYNKAITKQLEKIISDNGYKSGLFATGHQIVSSTGFIMKKGSKAHTIKIKLDDTPTTFKIFNLDQCVFKDEIKRTKKSVTYSTEAGINPPLNATAEELKELEKTLQALNVKNPSNRKVDILIDKKPAYTTFIYAEYQKRKQEREQKKLEKLQAEKLQAENENTYKGIAIHQLQENFKDNNVLYKSIEELLIDGCEVRSVIANGSSIVSFEANTYA